MGEAPGQRDLSDLPATCPPCIRSRAVRVHGRVGVLHPAGLPEPAPPRTAALPLTFQTAPHGGDDGLWGTTTADGGARRQPSRPVPSRRELRTHEACKRQIIRRSPSRLPNMSHAQTPRRGGGRPDDGPCAHGVQHGRAQGEPPLGRGLCSRGGRRPGRRGISGQSRQHAPRSTDWLRDLVAGRSTAPYHREPVSMAKLRSPLVARKKSPPLGLVRSCSGWFLLWLWLGACGRSRRR